MNLNGKDLRMIFNLRIADYCIKNNCNPVGCGTHNKTKNCYILFENTELLNECISKYNER